MAKRLLLWTQLFCLKLLNELDKNKQVFLMSYVGLWFLKCVYNEVRYAKSCFLKRLTFKIKLENRFLMKISQSSTDLENWVIIIRHVIHLIYYYVSLLSKAFDIRIDMSR